MLLALAFILLFPHVARDCEVERHGHEVPLGERHVEGRRLHRLHRQPRQIVKLRPAEFWLLVQGVPGGGAGDGARRFLQRHARRDGRTIGGRCVRG